MTLPPALHVIIGAGPLALATARALRTRGHRVRLVSRSAAATRPDGVEHVSADVLRGEEFHRAIQDAAVLYQCAQPPYHRWPEDFPALQRAVLHAAARTGMRVVLAENLYGYGPVDGPLHEDLPLRAVSRKGRARARMTGEALEAHARGEVQVAIARGADFFGPGVLNSTFGERLFTAAVSGRAVPCFGDPDQPHTVTYIEDFGEALALLGERQDVTGRAWHVANDRPRITQRELIGMICEQLRRPVRIARMGKTMLRIGGLFIRPARELIELYYQYDRPFVVDSGRMEALTGQRATPIERALASTIAWYRTRSTGG